MMPLLFISWMNLQLSSDCTFIFRSSSSAFKNAAIAVGLDD